MGAAVSTPAVAPAAQAPVKYFNVPLFGRLGTDVSPAALELAFNEAEQAQADYVVVLFDSPGGDPAAVSAMLRTISSHAKVQSVAFVRRATGAAAMLAAGCERLFIYKTGIWGTSSLDDVDEARACQAAFDQATAVRRRNATVIEAISDWGAELYVETVGGKASVQLRSSAKSRAIKQPGSGLVLTPQDMVNCQVADGICATMGDICHELGIESWISCGDRGAEIVKSLRPESTPIVIESRSADPPSDPSANRDAMYYQAASDAQEKRLQSQAERQGRYLDARQQEQQRAYEEQRRRDEERRTQENLRYLRRQNAIDQARKQREMDAVGRPGSF